MVVEAGRVAATAVLAGSCTPLPETWKYLTATTTQLLNQAVDVTA